MTHLKFVLISILLAGCSQSSQKAIHWTTGDDIRKLKFLNQIEMPVTESIQVLDEKIEFTYQNYSGIPIADTYIKKISHKDGQLTSVSAQYEPPHSRIALGDAKDRMNTPALRQKLLLQFPFLNPENLKSLILVIEKKQPVWQVQYENYQGQPRLLSLSLKRKVLSDRPLGASWLDRPALVFPLGPKFSALKEVALKNVSFHPALSNSSFQISSANLNWNSDSEELLSHAPGTPHFDQIQVYFYVEQALSWIRQNLGIEIPQKFDIQLHVGFPEKTNAAFYYNNKIRLGTGDGLIYSDIPLDPTIVTHEIYHGLIDHLSRLPHEGEGGSLNEAFADFFTSQQLKKPELGDTSYLPASYKRTLQTVKKWTEKSGGLYSDSLIVSGLLWQFSQELPKEKILKSALTTLAHLNPNSTFENFNIELRLGLKKYLTEKEQKQAFEILQLREFPE